MNRINYTFKYVDVCNMCSADAEQFKTLGKRLNGAQGKNPNRKVGITTSVCRCTNCNLVFSNPMPIPNDINDHYGTPPEDYWKPHYFEVDKEYFKVPIKKFKSLYPKQESLRALDVGAGIGKCMIALENAGIEAHGFEPSLPFYQRAIEKMNISPERLKLNSIEEIDYPANFFDFIAFGAVLEHVYDPSESINKAMKWLKPKGLIYFEIPSSQWLVHKIINFTNKMRGNDYVANISPMHVPFHLYEFDIQSFAALAEKNGYEIASYTNYVCETYLPKILDPILKPIMRKNNSGMQLEVWLRKT